MSNDSQQFAMDQRAFPVLPVSDRYFASQSAEDSRRRLTLCLERGDGPALLIGAAGCGKTMLLEVLAEQFSESFRVVRLASTQLCTRRALLQAILYGLKKPYREHDEGELRLSLLEALSERPFEQPAVALLVDEAQSLPVRLLEELRVLANHAIDGIPRLQLILAGTNTLDEAFTSPKLEAFNQRIMARCYLSPLTREETIQYVRAHIAVAGEDPDQLVADSAYRGIYQASDGVPRLINQVCDRALLMAVERNAEKVDAEAIQAAWSDLHQLPAPWHLPPTSTLQQPVSEVTTGFQAVEFDTNLEATHQDAMNPSEDTYAPLNIDSNQAELVSSHPNDSSYEAIEFGELSGNDTSSTEDLLIQVDSKEQSGCCSSNGCGSGSCSTLKKSQHESSQEHEKQSHFNADEALIEISTSLNEDAIVNESAIEIDEYQLEEEEDDHGCIAYTFPTRPTEEYIETESEIPNDGQEIIETQNLADPNAPKPGDPKNDEQSDRAEEVVKNPFDEQFDEEEVVLDRYSEIEAFAPSMASMVTNHKEIDFGRMFQALTPAVESLLDDVTQKIDHYDNAPGFGVVGNTPPLAKKVEESNTATETYEVLLEDINDDLTLEPLDSLDKIATTQEKEEALEDTVLIVEDAESEKESNPQVHRKEYSQLFASLREC